MDEGITNMGQPMKSTQKQIVTGLDRLVNPERPTDADTIFDSSFGRDINTGSVDSSGGINYKGLNNKDSL